MLQRYKIISTIKQSYLLLIYEPQLPEQYVFDVKVCYFGVVSMLLMSRKHVVFKLRKLRISQKHPHLSHELLRIPINKGIEAREGMRGFDEMRKK